MFKNRHNAISLLVVFLFGVVLLFIGTDGFTAFTEETARVNRLIQEKPVFPDVTLEDSKGRTYPISEFEGKFMFITFLYTACGTVCPQLEYNMAQVYDLLPQKYMGEEIVFLSISFDPERDDPETLERYRKAFKSDGETWRMARIVDKTELNTLLEKFGVIVIPDGQGNFTHNSAFYLVDKTGSLIEVMDFTNIEEAAEKVERILAGEQVSKR
ncbi:SCO family protein [Robertmurraya sp. DFI.2.37]|uniref:SCO family protein n=1 Tax=Robertmurraya sp. DFI.2.37 TaxID=3031819 RepID=UPI001245140C|nr:SCO family protein [Robertmurraya sp. DFI.2.37]MDF1510409.1 SCO family protein [Robertmurraya sp. DFI.2.37]